MSKRKRQKRTIEEMQRLDLVYVQMHERVDVGIKDGKQITVRRNGSDVKDILTKDKPC